MSIYVPYKPLSVNEAWQGRRFKTPKYKAYERLVLLTLKPLRLPPPPFELIIDFGFSNKMMDIDNCLKPTLDILQKKYGFNDRDIYRLVVNKKIVPKGNEYTEIFICEDDRNETPR